MSKYEEEEERIKVILLGSSSVGKTSLINSLIELPFNKDECSTYTASYHIKKYNIDKIPYDLTVWDTAGQEKFRSMSKLFCKNAKICVLVYDITSKESFFDLNSWLTLLKETLGDDFILGIVGNKTDLFEKEEVREEEAKDYANSIRAKYLFTSAKEDPKKFDFFIEELLKEYITKNDLGEKKKVINIKSNNSGKKRKKGFC